MDSLIANPIHSHDNRWSRANLGYHLYRNTRLRWSEPDLAAIPVAPLVVGAIGGSGSRILGQVLQLAGVWMGAWVNPKTQDAMATRHFLQRRFDDLQRAPEAGDGALERAFRRAIGAHRWGMPNPQGPWGWKNPRSLWALPFLARQFPRMQFVQLVRDGRDMALSPNRNLLHKHGDLLLPGQDWRRDPLSAQLQLWALGNQRAQEAGRRLLGERYLLLRYEDLCARPLQTLTQLFTQLQLPAELAAPASAMIRPSEGISRWRNSTYPALQRPEPAIAEALAQFGYR